jgi:alanine racemase
MGNSTNMKLMELTVSRCWSEIDLSAFIRNIQRLRKSIGHDIEILIPIKADAYGHGAVEMAKAAGEAGISYFGVSSLEEAIGLRKEGIEGRILFLTPPLREQLPQMIKYDITTVLADLDIAFELGQLAGDRGKVASVHVEVDTGMGRTGISWKNAAGELVKISGIQGLELQGIMTHFSRADESSPDFTMLQIERFSEVLSQVPKELLDRLILHASNSAASIRFPAARYSMIRPGLYLYGISPLDWKEQDIEEPEPVLSLRSRVVLVKIVAEGDPVSYGGKWVAPGERRIATISAGYRDGVSYALSRGGRVLIRGKPFSIAGSVCMDMMMVDLADDTQVAPGDPVTIIGVDGSERISAREVAKISGTIPYDVLCSVGMRVPRVYRSGDEVIGVRSILGTDRRETCKYSGGAKSNGQR